MAAGAANLMHDTSLGLKHDELALKIGNAPVGVCVAARAHEPVQISSLEALVVVVPHLPIVTRSCYVAVFAIKIGKLDL